MVASFTKKKKDLFDFHEHNLGPKGKKPSLLYSSILEQCYSCISGSDE